MVPPLEAIQAVDVSTSNYEASLGRAIRCFGGMRVISDIFMHSPSKPVWSYGCFLPGP
jgi:hypothetical protein